MPEKHSTALLVYQRCGPYIGGNLPKVRSRHCPHGILPRPYKVYIWKHFNFPMLNPHWPTCKYGPHLQPTIESHFSQNLGRVKIQAIFFTGKSFMRMPIEKCLSKF